MLTVDGRQFDYKDTGKGPAILFVPGSFSTPAAWRAMQNYLPSDYRFVSTSLCGYGDTEDTRTLDDLDMHHQTRVVEVLAERIDAPVHLVGHSFGGTIALASALNGKVDVLSLATFEANPLAVIHERGRTDLYEATKRMSEEFEAAHHAGERDAAGRIINFWGGDQSFENLPEPVQNYCRATCGVNVLDWRTAFRFQAGMNDYATLDMPSLIVRGSLANKAMIEITDALIASLPDCRSAVVEGAGHFLITSHAKQCASLLSDFLSDVLH